MNILKQIILLAPITLFSGCSSNLDVFVYDAITKRPIPNAYVYTNEFAMFSPFNSSDVYLTDNNGAVKISENIREGNINIFAGKENFRLALYQGKLTNKSSIEIFLDPLSTNKKFRIRKLLMRENLLKQYKDNSLLQNFIKYCNKQDIKIYKIPGWTEVKENISN